MTTREEAFEKWWSNSRNRIYHSHDAERARACFEAGYAAAIEAVKAGGVMAFEHRCPDSAPLYKLPEQPS